MLIDKYFHLYGRKADIVFEEIPKPQQEIELEDLDLFCRQRGLTVISKDLYAEMKARWSAQPEIIRCKDCKYWNIEIPYPSKSYEELHNCDCVIRFTKASDYCVWAERRTDE